MEEINLAWMYPDILNLHGDRGNIMAFERIANISDIKLNVHRINKLDEEIDFQNIDIMFFSPGELKHIIKIIESLKKYENQIKEFIENEKYIISIGTSGAIFAKNIKRYDNTVIQGLNILDMDCYERNTVIGDDIYFPITGGKEIIGSQIQMIDIKLNSSEALEEVKYGYGNDGTKKEGAKYKNLIFTNTLGPVFVKNPWWGEEILKEIASKKNINIKETEEEYEIEKSSLESTKRFIEGKIARRNT